MTLDLIQIFLIDESSMSNISSLAVKAIRFQKTLFCKLVKMVYNQYLDSQVSASTVFMIHILCKLVVIIQKDNAEF